MLAQHVAPPIAAKVAPYRVDVIAPAVVELDQELGTLNAKVIRPSAQLATGPGEADLGELGSFVHAETGRDDLLQTQVLLGFVLPKNM